MEVDETPKASTMKISCDDFSGGDRVPEKFTADGADVSPSLRIEGADKKAVSFALIMDDPDAPMGTFTHWTIWNIPSKISMIPEAVPKEMEVKSLGGARQGSTDFGEVGYGGASPPPGPVHRYRFKIYALDTMLDLKAGASLKDLEKAMKGHVISEATLTGLYGR